MLMDRCARTHQQVLDDKAVSEMSRQFLVNWSRHKEMKAAGLLPPPQPQPIKPYGGKSKALGSVSKPKFPSKFSSRNPHWIPPLPTKRKKEPGAAAVGSSNVGGAVGNSGRGGGYGGGGGGGGAGYAGASYGSNSGYGGNSYGGSSQQNSYGGASRQQQPTQSYSNNYGGDAYGGY